MTSLVERLRTTSTERTWDSVGRPYDYPKHLPLEAADRIESLERENAELRAENDRLTEQAIVGEYMWTPAELNEALAYGRRGALGEAAQIADREYKRHCTGSGFDSQPSRATAYSILQAIRALSVPSPTPLQEQNANSGKEGE